MLNSLLVQPEAFMLIMEFASVIQIILIIALCLKPSVTINNTAKEKTTKKLEEIKEPIEKEPVKNNDYSENEFLTFTNEYKNTTNIKIPKMYQDKLGLVTKSIQDDKVVYCCFLQKGYKIDINGKKKASITTHTQKELLEQLKKIESDKEF